MNWPLIPTAYTVTPWTDPNDIQWIYDLSIPAWARYLVRADLIVDSITIEGMVNFKSYTVAEANTLTGMKEGSAIYISNEIGGKTLAFYDGTNWKRTSDNATIS